MCITKKKILAAYPKKVPYGRHPSSGPGRSENQEGPNNLPRRLAKAEKKGVKKCGKGEMKKGRRGVEGGGH